MKEGSNAPRIEGLHPAVCSREIGPLVVVGALVTMQRTQDAAQLLRQFDREEIARAVQVLACWVDAPPSVAEQAAILSKPGALADLFDVEDVNAGRDDDDDDQGGEEGGGQPLN